MRAAPARLPAMPAGPIVSPMDVKAATDNRDSLAKTLYSRLFDWLVAKVNTSIGQDPHAVSLVGVLDIYGARSAAGSTFLACTGHPHARACSAGHALVAACCAHTSRLCMLQAAFYCND